MYKVDIKDKLAFCTNPETKEVYKLELIKSHSEFGNVWIFSNVLNMPFMRKAMFDLISQYETIGVDKKEVIMETQKGMNLINEGQPSTEVYTILSNLNSRVKDVWDYQKTAIALIGLLCIKESELENIGTYEQSIAQENINQWQKDSALFDFFLTAVQLRINNFWNTLDSDIVSYSQSQTNQKNENIKAMPKKSSLLSRITTIFKT